jgi:predicted short-subunit dehydrogenase-like oxidoreductase (DUF2520 family)
MKILKLNIIGCGHLGKSLAKLWSTHSCFEMGEVLNRSIESSSQATDFIAAGVAISTLDAMSPADVYLIATPDNEIIHTCKSLVDSRLLKTGDVVFHCSGAMSSDVLAAAKTRGAFICSVHPVKSFADPIMAAESFEGTYCGVEGDKQALDIVETAMHKIGGNTFGIQAEFKTLYHAASVIVCNYLTALLEMGIQTYQQSGLERETAIQVMQPMVRATVDNIFRMGTIDALSGPIARGDDLVVENHLRAISEWKPEYANLYAGLGEVALQLSQQQGNASTEALATIRDCLATKR